MAMKTAINVKSCVASISYLSEHLDTLVLSGTLGVRDLFEIIILDSIYVERGKIFLASADVTLMCFATARLQSPSQPWPSVSRIDRTLFQIENGPHPSEHLQ